MIDLDGLRLAARNHGMPLELLREPITPAGLHYLLIHFDIPHVDADAWRLEIGGLVRQPLALSLAELRARPGRTLTVTLECAGNGRALIPDHNPSQPWLREAVGTAEWTGTPLAPILREAGVEADTIVFTGLDRGIQGGIEHDYARSLPLEEALGDDVLLAYEMNGEPLLPQHGFPVRLLVPGWYGMASVKWLRAITVIMDEFDGYQQTSTYRIMRDADDKEGPFVERILPRSLLVPPGIPDFLTRERHVSGGTVVLEGRAWSGQAPVERVEVSTDGGETWAEAELEPPLGEYAWRGFSFQWNAEPGEHELSCRATDAAGNTQPLEPEWNYGGFCNNAVQRVRVSVSQGMNEDSRLGHAWLPKGVTGFRHRDEPPLPLTERRAILQALHAAFRGAGRQVGTATEPSPGRNYWEVHLSDPRTEDVLLLVNEVHPLAAFAHPGNQEPEFVDRPELADRLSHALLVLAAADLAKTIRPEDLQDLAEAERKQIRYWRPTTFGEIIFNSWD